CVVVLLRGWRRLHARLSRSCHRARASSPRFAGSWVHDVGRLPLRFHVAHLPRVAVLLWRGRACLSDRFLSALVRREDYWRLWSCHRSFTGSLMVNAKDFLQNVSAHTVDELRP